MCRGTAIESGFRQAYPGTCLITLVRQILAHVRKPRPPVVKKIHERFWKRWVASALSTAESSARDRNS
eukprot:2890421-Rhodomonas_salina.1